jgi:hypothetical protein
MKMPPECEISKEAEYNICFVCKLKCSYGRKIIPIWEEYKNDKWYEKMRGEIADVLEAR